MLTTRNFKQGKLTTYQTFRALSALCIMTNCLFVFYDLEVTPEQPKQITGNPLTHSAASKSLELQQLWVCLFIRLTRRAVGAVFGHLSVYNPSQELVNHQIYNSVRWPYTNSARCY